MGAETVLVGLRVLERTGTNGELLATRAIGSLTVDAAHAEVFDFEEFLDAVF